jgi:hypothetical protein
MHKLSNDTPWAAGQATGFNHKREQLAMVIIKASYAIDTQTGELTPLKKKPDIVAADQHEGDPLKSALIAAGESSPPKVGGEFYLLGATLTPPNADTPACEASVTLTLANGKTFHKTIRVVGKRKWVGNWLTPGISQPEPLTPTSLGYENAFGGTDPEAGPKDKHPSYLANYAGRGYLVDSKKCKDIELPQLEIAPYINSPGDHPSPAGFGPLPVFWAPRRSEFGTLDMQAAKRGACPYGPDAKATLHNAAPQDQRFPKAWQGGEALTLTNILSGVPYGKAVNLTLPAITPQLIIADQGQHTPLACVFDTFWIDAKKNQLHLIYRAAYPTRLAYPDRGWILVRDAAAEAKANTNETQKEAA